MYEKVNPQHPDKTADRIAGALVDLAYTKEKNPRVAVEVLLGHGICHIMAETSVHFTNSEVARIVRRIAPELTVDYLEVKQDGILAKNQLDKIRCGDNGIFRGVPVTEEQKRLTEMAKLLYLAYGKDGKYIQTDTYGIHNEGDPENSLAVQSDSLVPQIEIYEQYIKYQAAALHLNIHDPPPFPSLFSRAYS